MKNKIYKKNIVYPWDILGYVKLSNKGKNKILKSLINKHRFKSDIAKTLGVPDYWFHNFKRNDKIDTNTFGKIINLTKDNTLIKEIIQFNDDKGSSSIPYLGKFPIKYDPFWHFIFCLSVGDGCIHKGDKKKFDWYQKPKGLKEMVKLISKLGTRYEIKENIINTSSRLGRNYEIALLAAFFLDEGGMGTLKNNSEITLHQEGNLQFLEKIGVLLN